MKTIIWMIFGLLAIIWTGIVAMALKLVRWLLGSIGDVQVPVPTAPPTAAPPPDWMPPWVDANWVHALQASIADALNHINHALPILNGLSGWLTVLGWFTWGVIMALLLVLALLLHWLAGRDWSGRKPPSSGTPPGGAPPGSPPPPEGGGQPPRLPSA
ncbi:hypothetical protein [Achromobacter aloeverae]|uniref:Uncharacterized protein n=1 Tax=Achromobacter aloeverae TaxID=1750518 RepID=A0A4Q1HF23_9BURK|nr:hypothetical protein [Achromobacter aloeverae]RXN85192.1 hypothetical protein C7R54_22080 [Achromobacter aloeverae]